MEVQKTSRTSRRRKPLFDRTNILDKSSSRSPPSSSSSLPKPRSKLVSSNFLRRPRIGHGGSSGIARNSSYGSPALASAFSRPQSGSSSVVGYGVSEVGQPRNVYHRRQTETKKKCGVKALQLSPSSSSVERIESTGKKFNKIRDGDGIAKSVVTPCKRKQHPRLRQRDMPNNSLKDFIKQQQLYFAEIDAFELSEEEVAAVEASE